MKKVYVVSAVRTPIGKFGGGLSTVSAIRLGSMAIRGALDKINLDVNHIDEVYLGNVISAGLGQAPATQASLGADIGANVPCTLVNKVCASGLKTIMLGAQSIMMGQAHTIVAGGMESMTNIPYYLSKARFGYRYGNGELIDGLAHDGLTDAYSHCSMGICSDTIAKEMGISREEQDHYAIQSYHRVATAWKNGLFQNEVVPIVIQDRKKTITIEEDEEYKNVQLDKIPHLKAAFSKDGTATAANSSSINDGAAAVVLMSEEKISALGITPLAQILSFADASQDPMYFTTTPSLAIPKALQQAKIDKNNIDCYEINEAFSSVVLANSEKLDLDLQNVNIHGGAVALGHPLGASGTRIVVTLINALKQRNGSLGVASICNGGGGASALVLENT